MAVGVMSRKVFDQMTSQALLNLSDALDSLFGYLRNVEPDAEAACTLFFVETTKKDLDDYLNRKTRVGQMLRAQMSDRLSDIELSRIAEAAVEAGDAP